MEAGVLDMPVGDTVDTVDTRDKRGLCRLQTLFITRGKERTALGAREK